MYHFLSDWNNLVSFYKICTELSSKRFSRFVKLHSKTVPYAYFVYLAQMIRKPILTEPINLSTDLQVLDNHNCLVYRLSSFWQFLLP